jgi:hypothetical protein
MASFRPEVSVHELHPDAATRLSVGIRNLLDSTLTQTALAQIVDNMPIKGHFYGSSGVDRQPHPDIASRTAPTDEALSLAGELAAALEPMTLRIDAQAGALHTSLTWLITTQVCHGISERSPRFVHWPWISTTTLGDLKQHDS